jgi:hypothetical protein
MCVTAEAAPLGKLSKVRLAGKPEIELKRSDSSVELQGASGTTPGGDGRVDRSSGGDRGRAASLATATLGIRM